MGLVLVLLSAALIVLALLALPNDGSTVSLRSQWRARELFLSKLTDEQRRYWRRERLLVVAGASGRRYTISPYGAFNIHCRQYSYCLRVLGPAPAYDKLLAQRLLVESDEQTFLALANKKDLRSSY